MCRKHYQRWQKYGDPLMVKIDPARSIEERFWAKVDKNGPVPAHRPDLGPCWVWTGARSRGYGILRLNYKNIRAHIMSFTWEYGETPEGQELDHLCRNRACVRPTHLEAVDHWTNVARGISPHGVNAAKDRCRNGHLFTAENTRINNQGARVCIECARAACRASYHRTKAKKKAAA